VLYTTAVGQEGYKDQNGLGKSPGNMFDPQTSLDLGTEYLARMFVQTDGTEQSDYIGRQDLQFQFAPALRAFNASLRDWIYSCRCQEHLSDSAPHPKDAQKQYVYAFEIRDCWY